MSDENIYMKEDELLKLSKQGDHKAFKGLVEYFEQPIATVVKGILGDCPEAEDVGQEVFIRFYQFLHQFNGKSTLKTYLIRIAINLSLNEIKKRKPALSIDNNDISIDLMAKETESSNFENKDLLDKAMKQIPPEHRSVVVLRLMQGYSVKETAKILEIPEGTVLSRLSRAQEKLKQILKPVNSIVS